MLTKHKKVYYCEFCKKHSLNAGSMARHEKHCTANPDRECRVCQTGRDIKPLIEKYKTVKSKMQEAIQKYSKVDKFGAFSIGGEEHDKIEKMFSFEQVKEDVDGCPMCAFAVIRQVGFGDLHFSFVMYDLKTEMKDFWEEKNKESISQYSY